MNARLKSASVRRLPLDHGQPELDFAKLTSSGLIGQNRDAIAGTEASRRDSRAGGVHVVVRRSSGAEPAGSTADRLHSGDLFGLSAAFGVTVFRAATQRVE